MKKVLIVDTETTGLDPKDHRVIEVAAILYSVEHATPLMSYSTLIRCDRNEAEHINKIPVAALGDVSPYDVAWAFMLAMTKPAQAIVAHNAKFDMGFSPPEFVKARPWICTKDDIRWPLESKPRPSLINLTLDHGLGIATAHRAMADCDMIARLLTRCRELGYDINAMLEAAMPRPLLTSVGLPVIGEAPHA